VMSTFLYLFRVVVVLGFVAFVFAGFGIAMFALWQDAMRRK
jgi:hypothetical protein